MTLSSKTRQWTGVVRAKNTPLEAPGGGTMKVLAPEIGGRTVMVMKLPWLWDHRRRNRVGWNPRECGVNVSKRAPPMDDGTRRETRRV